MRALIWTAEFTGLCLCIGVALFAWIGSPV